MSTDYGIKCANCGDCSPCGELTQNAVRAAMAGAAGMIALWKVRKQFLSVLQDFDISVYWCSDIHNLMEWLVEHEGHSLMVIDEYGREHPDIK